MLIKTKKIYQQKGRIATLNLKKKEKIIKN